MYNKYENKTYTQGIQNEVSDIEYESKRRITTNNNNNNRIYFSGAEQGRFLKSTFQPKYFFQQQNNNISLYQSTSKSSYRSLQKNKNLSPAYNDKNSITLKKPPSTQLQICGGQGNYSYNYTTYEKNKNENSERIEIKENKAHKYKKPKRSIKSYQKEFNMEKSDNFNVLSYRPPEYESDVNKNKKIIIFKKQGVDEIFYPSKRLHSPEVNNDGVEKYQSHSLKFQSFFGSFNCSNNSRATKSTSKINVNQLNDFNIDKLIEIGDKYVLNNPVLPLGKIMNNNLMNRTSNNKLKIPINHKINLKNASNICEVKCIYNFSNYNLKNKNKNKDPNNFKDNSINLAKDKKRVIKKVISKNNLKSTKNNDGNIEQDNKDNTIKKNLAVNMESCDKTEKKLNSSISKKEQLKKSPKNTVLYHNNDSNTRNEMQTFQEIEPIKKNSRKKIIKTLNTNPKEKIENNQINRINYRKEKQQNDIIENKILIDDENNFRKNVKLDKINKINNTQPKEIAINENNNKKYNKNNKIPSNIYYKDNKPKNYYGYDERHNLEDTINNHAYYESFHSKKKINNHSFTKII